MTIPEWRCKCRDEECRTHPIPRKGQPACFDSITKSASCLPNRRERRLLCYECAEDLDEREPRGWDITSYMTEWPHGALNLKRTQTAEDGDR